MKHHNAVIVFCLCAGAVHAQRAALPPSCGDAKAVVTVSTHGHGVRPAPPEAGRAKAVFIERADPDAIPVVTRIALDGSWLGGNRGNSYFERTVPPGEHHVCADWDLPHRFVKDAAAFDVFTAEAGKTYYFLVNVAWTKEYGRDPYMTIQLSAVNSDQGQYLVLNSKISNPSVKP